MQLHARYSPSKLPRIILCPGSATAEGHEDPAASNAYADDGTKKHLIVAECLESLEYQVPYSIRKKYEMEQEDVDIVEDCLSYVFSLKAEHGTDDAYELIETKVSLAGFVSTTGCDDLEDVEGTADYIYVVPSKGKKFIVDWKFGGGIEVFPTSDQLAAYALGALKNPSHMADFQEIHKVIFQPKFSAEPKQEIVQPVHLMHWLKKSLVPALIQARAKHPYFNPSVEACRWCPIKATCEARRNFAKAVAVDVFTVHGTLPSPEDEDIARIMDKADALRKFLSDIEEYAYNQIKRGRPFPGYKLVSGRSSREWTNEQAALDWLSMIGLKEKDLYTSKLVSPAQAEKKVGKKWKKDPEFLNLINKKGGKPTLVRETDPREPITYESAVEVFQHITSQKE